jgi:hypothetical protein
MRRFLLALPLFLVVGLAFVELPSGNSAPGNQSVSVVNPMNLVPQAKAPTNTKIDIAPNTQDPFKKLKGGSNYGDDEVDNNDGDEGFEEEDD